MFGSLIKKIFGSSHTRAMKRMRPLVEQVNSYEDAFSKLSDDELAAKTVEFKGRLEQGSSLDLLLPEAFAAVREASKRVLGMRHYDVQMLGGITLHQGKIAEMKTGEGKTLVATAPLYLNALEGKGSHLVTVNDYLASRDADWMGKIYNFLGMEVGKILSDMSNTERRRSYACDITYGTNNEFGFDYLRDNMKFRLADYVQRKHQYAIVDEVDSILVDEARTPLIISGQIEQDLELYYTINKLIPFLKKDEDYIVDEKHHSVTLTDDGVEKIEKHVGVGNIYDPRHIEYLHHVNKALQAHTLYKLDQNYLIVDNKVVIVDEFTGRLMSGRRWSDGLHQAVEAKEGVPIQNESQTLATITFQNYFRMYTKLAGMTGTADTEAEEFKKTYGLDTLVVPTNMPLIRLDQPDVIYRSEREKIAAIIDQIIECNTKGQPILVGTVSVEKSEVISKVLKRKKISHSVLNAKNHSKEAEIVAQAGRKGSVTIATNMAGRGTDIVLGGNPEFLARKASSEEEGGDYEKWFAHFKQVCEKERQEVLESGGFYILGTERHESRRIDNQLRGRAGRQGDPGESRFYLSLEDDLMRIFGAERIGGLMDRLGMEPGVPIEHNLVSKAIENAQMRVEGRNFDIRKQLLEYDDVMNQQRKAVYDLRHSVVEGTNIRELVFDMLEAVLVAVAENHVAEGVMHEDWDIQGLLEAMRQICQIEFDIPDHIRNFRDKILEHLWSQMEAAYRQKEQEFQYLADRYNERYSSEEEGFQPKTGGDIFGEIEQRFYLKEIDQQWREHLNEMSALRDAIGLRGYAQKDPKQEYKREGYDIFVEMLNRTKSNVASQIFRVKVQREEDVGIQPVLQAPKKVQEIAPAETAQQVATESADTPAEALPTKVTTVVREEPKLRRNDPCWCGSGKKYKQCHWRKDTQGQANP
ncbi:MAG: preprotein translocase subunit SecA [Deltaproteobacteria bacterium CG2_30_63_29]|nr:MAG: preprotein translocase subunit SecA [Deltaproteobacteria bacterium CG2_30_63_29]